MKIKSQPSFKIVLDKVVPEFKVVFNPRLILSFQYVNFSIVYLHDQAGVFVLVAALSPYELSRAKRFIIIYIFEYLFY